MKYAINDKGYYLGPVQDNYSAGMAVGIPYPTTQDGFQHYLWDFQKHEWRLCYPVDVNGVQMNCRHLNEAFFCNTVRNKTIYDRWDFAAQKWVSPAILPTETVLDAPAEETWVDGIKVRSSFSLLDLTEENKQILRVAKGANPDFFVNHDIRDLSVFGYSDVKQQFTAYTLAIPRGDVVGLKNQLHNLYGRDFSIAAFGGYKMRSNNGTMFMKLFDTDYTPYSQYELPVGAHFDYCAVYTDPAEGATADEVYFTTTETALLVNWLISKGLQYSEAALDPADMRSMQFSIYYDKTTNQPISFKQYRRDAFFVYSRITAGYVDTSTPTGAALAAKISIADAFLASENF